MTDNQTNTIKQQKDAVRTQMRTVRSMIPSATRAQAAEALCQHADALNLPLQSIVALYWPVGTELDTRPLLRHLHKQGYDVALPRTVAPMAAMRFYRWTPDISLVNDIMGFPAPTDDDEVIPNIVMAPLLAFDNYGYRLGQGAGFYDLSLPNLRRQLNDKPLRSIGLAFACQQTDALPVEPHDQRMDSILTEKGVIMPLERTA